MLLSELYQMEKAAAEEISEADLEKAADFAVGAALAERYFGLEKSSSVAGRAAKAVVRSPVARTLAVAGGAAGAAGAAGHTLGEEAGVQKEKDRREQQKREERREALRQRILARLRAGYGYGAY